MKLTDAVLFPQHCVLCRTPLPTGTAQICPACASEVRRSYRRKTPFRLEGADGADAPLLYQGKVAAAMKRYKFQQEKADGYWFAAQTAACVAGHLAEWRLETVTYIPISFDRLWHRGFDQSRFVAERVAQELGLPCRALLRKKLFSGRQSQRKADERRSKVHGTFFALPGAAGRRVLLIDDIITTGATMTEGIRVLRQSGAAAVFAVGIAKTDKR